MKWPMVEIVHALHLTVASKPKRSIAWHQSSLFVALLSDQFILSGEEGGDFSVATFYEYLFSYRLGIRFVAALDLWHKRLAL